MWYNKDNGIFKSVNTYVLTLFFYYNVYRKGRTNRHDRKQREQNIF
nr:MAG TPA: hypothetical protein [Caudoviricetes sp.]